MNLSAPAATLLLALVIPSRHSPLTGYWLRNRDGPTRNHHHIALRLDVKPMTPISCQDATYALIAFPKRTTLPKSL